MVPKMLIKPGQVYKNAKATFEIKTVGNPWIKVKVTKHGELTSKTFDLLREQIVKMEKIKD